MRRSLVLIGCCPGPSPTAESARADSANIRDHGRIDPSRNTKHARRSPLASLSTHSSLSIDPHGRHPARGEETT
jgi:hypothetical protein